MPFKHSSLVSRKDYYFLDPLQIKIRPNWNPRQVFDTQEDEELKLSIIENGVLEPLEVKRTGEDIVLINGERRIRATLKAIDEGHEIKGVPCLVQRHTMSDTEAMFLALNTNTGKRLEPLEEAEAFNRLRNWDIPVQTIAQRMGKSVPFVYRRLLLVDASAELKSEVKDKKINLTVAENIIKESDGSVQDQNRQVKAAKIQKAKSKPKRKPNPPAQSATCPHCGKEFLVE
jgi:ParB/RepB/Spo0J family partition protein